MRQAANETIRKELIRPTCWLIAYGQQLLSFILRSDITMDKLLLI